MAVNLITGYDLDRTPMEYVGWGHAISYEIRKFQDGTNLPLVDIDNINVYNGL